MREPRRLHEVLEPEDVDAFVADLDTHRDRAMALAMLLGGLRAGEVRSLRLATSTRVCAGGGQGRQGAGGAG